MTATTPSESGPIPSPSLPAGNPRNQSLTASEPSLHGATCFRIRGIPSDWGKAELENVLKVIDPDLAAETFQVSALFPGCFDSSQTAILAIERCTKYLSFPDPDHEKIHVLRPKDETYRVVRLNIDKHFDDLTPLNNPEEPILADIIAVTGLAGHAFGSWRSRGCQDNRPLDRPMWLHDFLPEYFPQVRIMTYGYKSSLVRPNGFTLEDHTIALIQSINNSRRTCTTRPIILVGHSLGGLIIAKALIQWANGPSPHTALLSYVRGIFFFGTPHNGLRVNELRDTFSGKVRHHERGILEQLEESSELLQNQRDELINALSAFKGNIFSFFETEKTRSVQQVKPGVFQRSGDPFQMVKRTSAILSMPNESHFAIMSDHTNMVKFRSSDDRGFQNVVTCMRACFAQRVDVLKYLLKNVREDGNSYYIEQSKHMESCLQNENEEPMDLFLVLRCIDYKDWISEIGRADHLVYRRSVPASELLVPYIIRDLRNKDESSILLYFHTKYINNGSSKKVITTQVLWTFLCQAVQAHPDDTRGPILQQFFEALLTSLKDEEILQIQADSMRNPFENVMALSGNDALWSAFVTALVGLTEAHRHHPAGKQGHARGRYRIILDLEGWRGLWFEIISTLCHVLLYNQGYGFLNIKFLIIDPLYILSRLPSEFLQVVDYDIERSECLESLRFNNTRYDKIAEHYPNTLEWLWESPEYKSWNSVNHEDTTMFFIEGKPGSGKSTLLRYFVDHFMPPKNAIVTKFFYNARDGESETDHRNMLRAVLYQILQEDISFFIHFQPFFRLNRKIGWSSKEMKAVLRACKLHPRRRNIYLIIDAMDESTCTDRAEIACFLHDLSLPTNSATGCVMKVFLASRPINELQVQKWNWRRAILLQDMNRPDIEQYTNMILDNEKFSCIARDIKEEITQYILNFSDGVFLWVFLVLEELADYAMNGARRSTLIIFLKSLPKSLGALYQCILNRLASNNQTAKVDGRRVLQFCLFSPRTIELAELEQALAIPGLPQDDNIDFRHWERDIPQQIRKYLTHCVGGFVDIKESSMVRPVVQIMHQTVREFFIQPSLLVKTSDFDISDPQDSQDMIEFTCARFLEIVAIESFGFTLYHRQSPLAVSHTGISGFVKYLEKRPFIKYSLEYLMKGKGHITPRIEDKLSELGYNLEHSPGSASAVFLNRFLSLQGPHLTDSKIKPLLNTLILEAASKGYLSATLNLLAASADIHAQNEKRQTPLHLAAREGHHDLTKLLLDSFNVGLEFRDVNEMTVLHHAITSGDKAVIELLLQRGASVESRDIRFSTALHFAASKGDEEAIQLLLAKDANRAYLDVQGRTAFHRASENGHYRAAELLRPANLNDPDHQGLTALHLASMKGHASFIRSLLTHCDNVDIDSCDHSGLTALHHASANGHDSVIQVLLTKKEYTGAGNSDSLTARHAPFKGAHDESPQSRQADIKARDNRGFTALHHAATNGWESTIRILLTNKEDINARDNEGRTALHHASEFGRDGAVLLLLANINARDNRGLTALHYAALNGCNSTIEILLVNNVDIDARDNEGYTALDLASTTEYTSTAHLLHHGARNAENENGPLPNSYP